MRELLRFKKEKTMQIREGKTEIVLPDKEIVCETVLDVVVNTVKLPFKIVSKLFDWIIGND